MKRLKISVETVRHLTLMELHLANGGERTTGPIDLCVPASGGYPSCTGCRSINVPCVTDDCGGLTAALSCAWNCP